MGSGVRVCTETGPALENTPSTLSPSDTRCQSGVSVLLRRYGTRDSTGSGRKREWVKTKYIYSSTVLNFLTFQREMYLLLHHIYLMPVECSFSESVLMTAPLFLSIFKSYKVKRGFLQHVVMHPKIIFTNRET